MKRCSRCKNEKSIDGFYFSVGKVQQTCKQCRSELEKIRYANNPEKKKASSSRRYATKPEYSWALKLKKAYGLTIAQYESMYRTQNGVCAICSCMNLSGRRLAVDHDHKTGKIRELLCARCNSAIGYARESTEILNKAIAYIEKHEAMGVI